MGTLGGVPILNRGVNMSEKRNGFIRFDNIDEFENYIKNLKIRRKINGLQVHHMALPNYACFYKGKGVTEDELVRTINLDYYGKSKGLVMYSPAF